jgi:hypothetical protein
LYSCKKISRREAESQINDASHNKGACNANLGVIDVDHNRHQQS